MLNKPEIMCTHLCTHPETRSMETIDWCGIPAALRI